MVENSGWRSIFLAIVAFMTLDGSMLYTENVPGFEHLFAFNAYDWRQLMDKVVSHELTVHIVKRTEAAFIVLPRC